MSIASPAASTFHSASPVPSRSTFPRSSSQPPSSALAPPPSRSWAKHFRRSRSAQGLRKLAGSRSATPVDQDRPRSREFATVPFNAAAAVNRRVANESDARGQAPVPTIVVHDEPLLSQSTPNLALTRESTNLTATDPSRQSDASGAFLALDTSIPTGDLGELSSPEKIKFSSRGSMMIDGKKWSSRNTASVPAKPAPGPRNPPSSRINLPGRASARTLSSDEVALSQKVRSMYEHGSEKGAEWSENTLLEEKDEDGSESSDPGSSKVSAVAGQQPEYRGAETFKQDTVQGRRSSELAGGIEDWEDVGGGEVDRYGFIMPRSLQSRNSNKSAATFDVPGVHRTTTVLLEASESPRRKLSLRRKPSTANSHKSTSGGLGRLGAAGRSTASINSFRSQTSFLASPSPLRYAANRLPHNKDRRWMDEASDMLTLPPGLAQLAEEEEAGRAATALKRKEWQREEKWRKMGKATRHTDKGGGMLFEFDAKDPKVLSRAWKGIPDRWRASAWYSFLAASEAHQKKGLNDDLLIECFHAMQHEGSADDVQIDCDVPRTINRHIMFRKRYRGGQRLLFRVLHAMSLYFPDTGYVQGMAALAATLLCYYDEEHAFIMMVRLWQLRGLDRLYQAGFGGLMDALGDFEKNWLGQGEVAMKLQELGITSTAYGTRWYLTLFNYSIPFPAQLRVWDVFMLLGDVANSVEPNNGFGADLDALHATSAALIDATREILLDSDFENAMKVLTSWIPIKDEDLMMRVAHAEWRLRKKRAGHQMQ